MSPCHGEDRQFKSDRGRHILFFTILYAVAAEWQTRYFEGVVNESSYGFKSHQPHHLNVQAQELFLSFFRVRGTRWGLPAVSAAFPKQLIVSNDRFSIRS